MACLLLGSGPLPLELITLRLCRDVYHCTPSELAKQDLKTVLRHMVVMNAETTVAEKKKKAK